MAREGSSGERDGGREDERHQITNGREEMPKQENDVSKCQTAVKVCSSKVTSIKVNRNMESWKTGSLVGGGSQLKGGS